MIFTAPPIAQWVIRIEKNTMPCISKCIVLTRSGVSRFERNHMQDALVVEVPIPICDDRYFPLSTHN